MVATSSLTGRNRVVTALDFEEADRIPIDYWADGEVTEKLIQHLGLGNKEELLRRLQVDLRYVMGPSYAGQQFRDHGNGLIEDHWGVLRQKMTVEGVDRTGRPWSWSYQHVHTSPLERATTVQEIEAYDHWPSAQRWDYGKVKQECLAAKATGCAVVQGGDRLDRTAQLKPATYLRGLEPFMSDLLLAPALAECLLEHIVHYYLEYNERVFRAAEGNIDIFFMGDDMGTQTSLWVSPALYRKCFKANLRRFIDLAHGYNIKTMYHTCGNVTALVPDFIDCGLDVLQSLQPTAMDLAALKREYGRHLAFQGGLDIQRTLPQGSPEEVRAEVKQRAETLGPGGGYIFCTAHNLLPDVPLENIEALFAAYLEHGRYR
jgi:uroporphyrinogen decarboxylase